MYRQSRGRGSKRHEAVSHVRRRQSDARWRANVASCFETLKQVIPVNMRACRRQISKAAVLTETQKHINFLESTLCSLLEAKAKFLNKKDDESLHKTPDDLLTDIQEDFISKQHDSMAALKGKKSRSHKVRIGVPHHSFIHKGNSDSSSNYSPPRCLRNRGRCQDGLHSPRSFATRLLHKQLGVSEDKEEDDMYADIRKHELIEDQETKQQKETPKQKRKQPSNFSIGKKIYELSPRKVVEHIDYQGFDFDHTKASDKVDFIKQERIEDSNSPFEPHTIKLEKSDEFVGVKVKTEENLDQFVPDYNKDAKNSPKKTPKFISLKYVGSLVPDQLDKRCIQKVTKCPVLGRVIVITPGTADNSSNGSQQNNGRQCNLQDSNILAAFKSPNTSIGRAPGQRNVTAEDHSSLLFNDQNVVEVTIRTSKSNTSNSQTDYYSGQDELKSELDDLTKAFDKVDHDSYAPLSMDDLDLLGLLKSDHASRESEQDSQHTDDLSCEYSKIKTKPTADHATASMDLTPSIMDSVQNMAPCYWGSLDDPQTSTENTSSSCGFHMAPCGTPCLSLSPANLFSSSVRQNSVTVVFNQKETLATSSESLAGGREIGRVIFKTESEDSAENHVVPSVPKFKSPLFHESENANNRSDLEVPKSVQSHSDIANIQATPRKTPSRNRVVFTPQSLHKKNSRAHTTSNSPARIPYQEFGTPGKRIHSPERSAPTVGTPAHKRDRRPLAENSSVTPLKLTPLATPTRRPVMTYESTPNKASQSPSGSSLGFTPVRLPYDHTPTSGASPFSPYAFVRRRTESQSDWETESLRCDEDDICSDDEEDTENLTPKSRSLHKSNRKQDLKARSRSVPQRGRRRSRGRGRPRCDSETSVRTLNSMRASSEKRRSRLLKDKKVEGGAAPKCCRFLDLTHVDEDKIKTQHNYSKSYQVSEYFDLHDQPHDFDRYLQEYQAAVDQSIRASPGESDATWSADEGEPIPNHINLIWQDLMATDAESPTELQFSDEDRGNEMIRRTLNYFAEEKSSSVPDLNVLNNLKEFDKTSSQVVSMLPDDSEPSNFFSISLTADGSLASSADLSDDLKDIDIQPITYLPDQVQGNEGESAVDMIIKQEVDPIPTYPQIHFNQFQDI